MSFVKKKRQGKALWTQIQNPTFQLQAKQLRPEKDVARSLRYRSDSEKVRMEIYVAIATMFKERFPFCQCCKLIRLGCYDPRPTDDVHHMQGRDGLLLFDVRKFKAACRQCHQWIQDHPKEAIEIGLSIERAMA